MKNLFYSLLLFILLINSYHQINLLLNPNDDLIEEFVKRKKFKLKEKTLAERQCLVVRRLFNALPKEEEVVNSDKKIRTVFSDVEIKGLQSFESFLVHFLDEILKESENPKLKLGYNEKVDSNVSNMINEKVQELKEKNDNFTNLKGLKTFEGNLTGEGTQKEIFDEILAMYGVVTKMLKESMVDASVKQKQISKSIETKKKEFVQLLLGIKKDYQDLRLYVSSFQHYKNYLKDMIRERHSKSTKLDEYKRFMEFMEGLDEYPSTQQSNTKRTDLELFLRDLTDEEFNKENDQSVIRIPFWEKAEVWKGMLMLKKKEILKNNNIVFDLAKKVNDDLLLGSYKELMKEAKNYQSPELENFIKNQNKLKHEQIKFDNLMNQFIKEIKLTINRSQYVTKDLNKDSTVIFLTRDYKMNITVLKEWKIKILNLENKINENMVLLREKNDQVKLLNIENREDFKFVISNDSYLELQRRVGLAEASFQENDQEFLEKYRELTYMELYEKWKIAYVEYNKNKEKFMKNEEDLNNLGFLSKYTTYLKMSYYLRLLQMKQNLKEILTIKLAQFLGQIQNMDEEKSCLTLPQISLNIFKLIKTNLITFEKVFFETFLTYYNFEKKKKFITYNYMITENKLYSLKQIEILEQEDNDDPELILQKQNTYVDNFTTNFSLFIGLSRSKSNFSSNLTEIKTTFSPTDIMKTLLSIINIDWEVIKQSKGLLLDLAIHAALDAINTLILAACPFLAFIPFSKFILKKIELIIVRLIIRLITVIIQKAKQKIIDYQKSKETRKITHFSFEVQKILDDVQIEQPNFKVKEISEIELKYISNVETSGFDFNSLEQTSIYYNEEQLNCYKFIYEHYLLKYEFPNIVMLVPKGIDGVYERKTDVEMDRDLLIQEMYNKSKLLGTNTRNEFEKLTKQGFLEMRIL